MCSQGISQFYPHTHTFIRNRNEPQKFWAMSNEGYYTSHTCPVSPEAIWKWRGTKCRREAPAEKFWCAPPGKRHYRKYGGHGRETTQTSNSIRPSMHVMKFAGKILAVIGGCSQWLTQMSTVSDDVSTVYHPPTLCRWMRQSTPITWDSYTNRLRMIQTAKFYLRNIERESITLWPVVKL